MTQATSSVDAESLLAQVSWVKRLARTLVRDEALAEDLAQDACVAALEGAPHDGDSVRLRGWLGGVVRNLVRQRLRGEGRRRAREASAARAERLEPADATVERLAVQRSLVEAVLGLHEPYRTAIVLRFFEELPPREIARRLEASPNTVQRRITRGLALLRERLRADRDHESGHGGSAWSALVFFANRIDPVQGVGLGGLVVNAKIVTAAVALAAAGIAATFALSDWAGREPSTAEPAEAALARPELDRPADVEPLPAEEVVLAPAEQDPVSARMPTGAPRPEALADAPELPGAWRVEGRVLDAGGGPVPGLVVAGEGLAEEQVTSGQGGWFAFTTDADSGELSAAAPEWVTVRAGVYNRGSSYDPVVVVAPSIALSGTVVDEGGRSLEGALVSFNLPPELAVRFGDILDSTRERSFYARSDERGSFELESVPGVSGSLLTCALDGYDVAMIPVPSRSDDGVRIVLSIPRAPLAGALRGRVVDPEGSPVASARVGLGLTSVLSGPGGDFEIDLAGAVTAERLTAIKGGYLPARMDRPGDPEAELGGWPDHVVLRLPAPALSITGRVVDAQEEPVAGALVWLADPQVFGPIGMAPVYLESLLAGAEIPGRLVESQTMRPPGDGNNYMDWTYSASGPANVLWYYVETGADGGFELAGLDERSYRLNVMSADSIRIHTTGPIPAGARGEVVRVDGRNVYERVAGRVVGPRGDPVAGVDVMQWVPVSTISSRVFGGTTMMQGTRHGERVVTDGEGRFSFENAPKNHLRLALTSDEIVPLEYVVEDETPDDLEIAVHFRCHFQVTLGVSADRADAIAVATEDGQRLDVLVLSERSMSAFTDVPLVDGRSQVVSVSSEARRLLLMKDGVVVEEHPLSLIPGDVNRIEI